MLLTAACDAGPGWDATIEGEARPAAEVATTDATRGRAARALDVTGDKTILFGDLHVHTSYSWDGFLFTLPLFGGDGGHPPADACDFARYCSALDFFALTDHAEALRPAHWAASKQSVRDCNARAGSGDDPDLVAFMGFEWTQAGLTPEDHWGHRCLVYPGTAEDELPARPIAAADRSGGYAAMRPMFDRMRWFDPVHWGRYDHAVGHLDALAARGVCPEGVPVRELPPDCLEVARTPADLHAKLDEWGHPVLEIPHGTAWGIYTPRGSALDKHLTAAQFDPERQRAIEIHSGHGNAEEYRAWRHAIDDLEGAPLCPEPSDDFLPCCWQAGEIMRARCGGLPEDECERRVARAREYAASAGVQPTRVFPDASAEEWLDCGQCRDCFKPSYDLRPQETVQYAMALTDFASGQRFRYGFVGSSDIHDARAGTGYKQTSLALVTDNTRASPLLGLLGALMSPEVDSRQPQPVGARAIGITGNDPRVQDFLYGSGLAAVHASGRSREAIWQALQRREVYGTSGPRILLWFDLVNDPSNPAPMGSEVVLAQNPVFEVRAVGSRRQRPGCPEWSLSGLSPERLERLCASECYHPGERRRHIERIDVVRILPQIEPAEAVDALIEDPWRSFPCAPDPAGCRVRFEDRDFVDAGRDALYYVRALEEPSEAIAGDPLARVRDDAGSVVGIVPCAERDDPRCLGSVRERAWSSPIFVNRQRAAGRLPVDLRSSPAMGEATP